MNSRNHIMFGGSYDSFAYKYLAGIRSLPDPEAAGKSHAMMTASAAAIIIIIYYYYYYLILPNTIADAIETVGFIWWLLSQY